MWHNKTGKLDSNCYVLGNVDNPIYLIGKDDCWALIEGGCAYTFPIVLNQLKQIVIDLNKIQYWFITHSHYDHVGLLEYLLPKLPNAIIIGSPKTIYNLRNEKYLESSNILNNEISSLNGEEQYLLKNTSDLLKNRNLIEIKEGEHIKISPGLSLMAIETPGHSKCSISYLDSEKDRLFVSDALGQIVDDKTWFPLAFDNIEQYEKSIKKIISINAKSVFPGHNGYLTNYPQKNTLNSLNNLNHFIDTFGEVENIEETAKKLNNEHHSSCKMFVTPKMHYLSMKRQLELARNTHVSKNTNTHGYTI